MIVMHGDAVHVCLAGHVYESDHPDVVVYAFWSAAHDGCVAPAEVPALLGGAT